MMARLGILLSVWALLPELGWGASPTAAEKIDEAWRMVWSRFYQPSVQTFADYLSSYEPGRELAHLPTADEVKRQYPNPCGYSTGMEDGAILGGAMLSVLCDRFAVTVLMAPRTAIPDAFVPSLDQLISGFDYEHNSSCGLVYHLAAHWKARRESLPPGN